MNFQLSFEKKINKLEQKEKILEKNENVHEIRKKHGLCPGVFRTCFVNMHAMLVECVNISH